MKSKLILLLIFSFGVGAQAQTVRHRIRGGSRPTSPSTAAANPSQSETSGIHLGVTPITAIPKPARIQFSESDACDLKDLYFQTDKVLINTNYTNIYSCTYYACATALTTDTFLTSKYHDNDKFDQKGKDDLNAFCERNSNHVEGFESPDDSRFKCLPVRNSFYYELYKFTPIPIARADITLDNRCHALRRCADRALNPQQLAWAEWKSASLYCQMTPEKP